ncbi:MAG TPA: hypothetical protein PKD26_01275 [Pyrinomonadaceae bacterium]|nr:hypothetical protein [Pyrinomonadaceae bacterium]
MPETLLSLYQASDGIYSGTFERTAEGGVLSTTPDYSVIGLKHHFTVSSTLKGTARKFVVIDDYEYRYHAQPEPEVESETDGPDEEPNDEYAEGIAALKGGETVLLFVRHAKDDDNKDSLKLTDFSDGVKALSEDKIEVYSKRIDELTTIFDKAEVNANDLLAWLIRCAENPATRWEGSYELLQSVRQEMFREQLEKSKRERAEKGIAVEADAASDEVEWGDEEMDGGSGAGFDTSVFAKMLGPDHKEALANILLDPKKDEGVDADEPGLERVKGDRELIDLVALWKDPRLIGFLLEKLRAGSSDRDLTSQAMSVIAEILDDGAATKIASDYAENQWYDDNEEYEEDLEESADDVEMEADDTEETSEQPKVPAQPEDVKDSSVGDRETLEVKKLNYAEFRAELVQKFIARCDLVLALRADAEKGR